MKFITVIILLSFIVGSTIGQNDVDPLPFQLDLMVRFLLKLPESLDNEKLLAEGNVHFLCTNPTTNETQQVQINDPEIRTKLDFRKKFGFLIHGWVTSAEDPWCLNMALDWAKYHDFNVCRIEWANLSFSEYFMEALQSNIYTVAEYSVKFLDAVLNAGFKIENVACVGHSFGSHICGYIGQHYHGELPLIVGLDVAGIGFTVPFLLPSNFRLDSSDAQFVIAVHSCNFGLGSVVQVGHQDFYINSGVCLMQKGCMFGGYVDAVYEEPLGCGHYRAVQIFADSLNPNGDKCLGRKCFGLLGYTLGHCTNDTDILGFNSKRVHGQFFMKTGIEPICTGELP